MNKIKTLNLGIIPYEEALAIQEGIRLKRQSNEISDTLIFCEHPPVYTIGKKDCDEDFLSTRADIESYGIEIIKCNRGGRITYHGPGQLVVYFIFKIDNFCSGIKDFVHSIEAANISYLASIGLRASRKQEYPGIWLDDKKICAIGLHVSKGVSMHGMAINVSTDLSHYGHIIPCGIKKFGVTSLREKLQKNTPSIDDVKLGLLKNFSLVFDRAEHNVIFDRAEHNLIFDRAEDK